MAVDAGVGLLGSYGVEESWWILDSRSGCHYRVGKVAMCLKKKRLDTETDSQMYEWSQGHVAS